MSDTMHVDQIEGYYDCGYNITCDWFPVEEGYGQWLEGNQPARYATGPEESVWIYFDEDGDPYEFYDEDEDDEDSQYIES